MIEFNHIQEIVQTRVTQHATRWKYEALDADGTRYMITHTRRHISVHVKEISSTDTQLILPPVVEIKIDINLAAGSIALRPFDVLKRSLAPWITFP